MPKHDSIAVTGLHEQRINRSLTGKETSKPTDGEEHRGAHVLGGLAVAGASSSTACCE